jgi:hypothetical protein
MGVNCDHQGVTTGSMGTDVGDYDGCGRPSVWVTNYENELHSLFYNRFDRGPFFTWATMDTGIAAIGQQYVGFGTAFVDVDNDGWEDIVIANGHVIRFPPRAKLKQQPVLFHNIEKELANGEKIRAFRVMTKRGGSYCTSAHIGRGLAACDLDNDGRADLVFTNVNEPLAVLRNVDGSKNRWLGVQLKAKENADFVGAHLTLEVNGRKLTRFAKGGGSYLCSGDRRFLFGLGQAEKAGRLTVAWPSGTPATEHWDELPVGRYHTLVQGTGKAE